MKRPLAVALAVLIVLGLIAVLAVVGLSLRDL